MKIAAEQVRHGMVVCGVAESAAPITLSGPGTGTKALVAREVSEGKLRFLGCDPALAARSDCEQFGIAEGFDAAAHGFARTREGGAVDLRKTVINGAVIRAGRDTYAAKAGERFVNHNAWLRTDDAFVGLDARHVSPEDVRRLCCGASRAPAGETFRHITETGKRDVVCTLAIGDHDTHEDIAAGVKWPAESKRMTVNFVAAPVTFVGVDPASGPSQAVTAYGTGSGFRFGGNDGSGDVRFGDGPPFVTTPPPALSPTAVIRRRANEQAEPVEFPAWKPACAKCFTRHATHTWTMANAAGSARAEVCAGCYIKVCAEPRAWVILAGKVEAVKSESPMLTIGTLRVAEFTIANPVGVGRVIEFTVPRAAGAQEDAYVAAMEHLDAGLPIEVRGREKTMTGHAVRWAHGPASDSRAEWFAVTFRESDKRATPAPQAPKVSPTAARDAAVAKAVADVPAGCSAAGWRNVVHVLAADGTEEGIDAAWYTLRVTEWAPIVAAYARERSNGYGREQATKRAGKGYTYAPRLFAAYEAGR